MPSLKTKNYEDFLKDLGFRESSGNYREVNKYGYLGKYQFGYAMLTDLGYYKNKNWTGKDNIYSKEDFLNNPEAQEKAILSEMKILDYRLKYYGFDKYIGREINGIKITKSGIFAGMHLKGAGGVGQFLKNNSDNSDALGTKVSEYINKFQGYQTPYNKGNHSSNYFIWRCEGAKSCEECKKRDGGIYEYGIDIEPPLHPNCDCEAEDFEPTVEQTKMLKEIKEIKNIHNKILFDVEDFIYNLNYPVSIKIELLKKIYKLKNK